MLCEIMPVEPQNPAEAPAACQLRAKQEALFEEYRRFAHVIAGQIYNSVRRFDEKDLIQSAEMGLWEAVLKYDGRCKFLTFAYHRVRGAVFDYIRSVNWGTRRNPATMRTVPVIEDRGHGRWLDHSPGVPADTSPDAVDEVENILRFVTPKQRTILVLVYLEGMSLAEAGEACGFSESRACQLRLQAFKSIRAHFGRSDADCQ